jgi:hypothetical protein
MDKADLKFYDRHHAFEFLVGCEVARRLLEDPSLIAMARIKLEEHLGGIPNHRDAYNLWSKLIELPVEEVARKLSQNDDEGDYIRQTMPSFIALPTDVRWKLIEEARTLARHGEGYSAESIKVLAGVDPPRNPGSKWGPPKKRDCEDTPEMAERRKLDETAMHNNRLAGQTGSDEKADEWTEQWIRGEITLEENLARLGAKCGVKSRRGDP